MKTLLVMAAIITMTTTIAAATEPAKPLPQCDDPEVKKTLAKSLRPTITFEIKDMKGSGDKRWCFVYFASSGPYMEAVYTLEWINEPEGRWWLQVLTSSPTCRGVMGNPWSTERCG